MLFKIKPTDFVLKYLFYQRLEQ